MARERIINLRYLSAEISPSSLPPLTPGRDSQPSGSDGDSHADHGLYSDSVSDSHSPLIAQPELTPGPDLVTECHRPTSSFRHSRLDDGEQDENEDVEDGEDKVALIKAQIGSRNPYYRLPPSTFEIRGLSNPSHPTDLIRQTMDMGRFMNQVTKTSNQIDSIERDLNEHRLNFGNEQAFRLKLYQKIEHEIIPDIIQLRATISQSNNSSSNFTEIDQGSDGPILETNVNYRSKDSSSSRHIENPLKREQIHLLTSKLSLILNQLINQLNSEKRMIGNEIKYEWNKELNRCPVIKNPSITVSSSEEAGDTSSSIEYATNDDPTNPILFKLMGLDDNHIVSPPPRSVSNEIHKRLNLAVRYSTDYPQARKSSLIILSEFDQLQQIQMELEQINLLIKLLSQHSLYRPPPLEVADQDDSSSVSLSLDGLDQDITATVYDEEKSPEEDKLKRKQTYKKIKFRFDSKRNNLTTNEEDEDDQLSSKHSSYDLESNNHYRYSGSSLQSHTSQFSFISNHWFHPYRYAILFSVVTSVILTCTAIGLYFIIRRHDS